MNKELAADALRYHSGGSRPGKIEIRSTKPMESQWDLSLAYTPGVAVPCQEIAKDGSKVWDYTSRGNLVAVITNGTAVLGLGNIGPKASKPVMEGKSVLFKRFAGIDVFDLEVEGTKDTFIQVVKALEPTFGGINLEDIKAPEAFYIEEALREQMSIPVFHDDQHGTAIITGASLINAAHLQGKALSELKLTVVGAGAAAQACAQLFISLGVQEKNLLMVDEHGTLRKEREAELDRYQRRFIRDTPKKSLREAIAQADVLVGLSVGGIISEDMIASMADKPIVFVLANPEPEILPEDVWRVRPDAIVATGRSDYPNQVNNVLGFPFIFRGALDVRAREINEAMKIAAVHALAALAREPVPSSVIKVYGGESISFGPNYIIPKPFDERVLVFVASAVAKAAMDSGVARIPIKDWPAYHEKLEQMMDPGRGLVQSIIGKAKRHLKRVLLPEYRDERVLKAANMLAREKIAIPVIVGNAEEIKKRAADYGIGLDHCEIVDTESHPRSKAFKTAYLELMKRRGVTKLQAHEHMKSSTRFALMMLREGLGDSVLLGATTAYSEAAKHAFQLIGTGTRSNADGGIVPKKACGLYILLKEGKIFFFADTTVQINPSAEELAAITLDVVDCVKQFNIVPRVAMLSFANFGSVKVKDSQKMAVATELVKKELPELMIEGEIQVDLAVDMELRERMFPWSRLTQPANVFIFPNLASANVGYKLMHQLGGASIFGPILLGMDKSVQILALNGDSNDIVNLAAYAAMSAHLDEQS